MITGISPMSVATIAINERIREVSKMINVIMKAATEKATPTP
jgi:hypothetical protein|tara:strand:+ start:423 stop:548 length:126 start_codon:yes stop_codon:yes gene_type:complete